jgi:hypothetical protein
MVTETITGREILFLKDGIYSEQGCLAVQNIKYGFNKEKVGASVDKPPCLFGVGLNQVPEINCTGSGIVHIR